MVWAKSNNVDEHTRVHTQVPRTTTSRVSPRWRKGAGGGCHKNARARAANLQGRRGGQPPRARASYAQDRALLARNASRAVGVRNLQGRRGGQPPRARASSGEGESRYSVGEFLLLHAAYLSADSKPPLSFVCISRTFRHSIARYYHAAFLISDQLGGALMLMPVGAV